MDKMIIDAMGGDNGVAAAVEGCHMALKSDKDIYLILTGRKDEIETEIAKFKDFNRERVEIVDCPEVVDMNDVPTEALRAKRNSSIFEGFWRLRQDADIVGLVTAGSTGAAIVGAQTILGRIRGVKRPALCPGIPNVRGGYTLLCDCGANAECKPEMLCQFAVLGTAYAEAGFGIKNARVGLLNNGTEEHKGDPLRQETYKLLSRMKSINFVGNVEGRDIMMGDVDVVVADGFSGNVALKSMEGCGKLVSSVMNKSFRANFGSKMAYLFARNTIKKIRAALDFEKFGGAMLLGCKKVVVKTHGSSKAKTFAASIENAVAIHRAGLIPKIEGLLAEVDLNSLTAE
ncbi:MAG: phosphate acyltransferase PlsX [Clostridia bacterium]|nr:phosphate acyltransferase PlsX [Clostridia bacterium]